MVPWSMLESRTIRISNATIIRAILLVIATYFLIQLRDILLLILVSIVIASFVEAGVHALSKYKMQRMMAVTLIFACTVLIIFAIFYKL